MDTRTVTAEGLLMGGMLLDDEVRAGVWDKGVTPETFQSSQVRQLAEVVRDMDALDLPIEANAIRHHADGMGYDILTEWIADLRTSAIENPRVMTSYPYYVEVIQETERQVRGAKAAQEIIDRYRRDPNIDIQSELAQALMRMQSPPREKRGGWISDLLPSYLDDVVANWKGEGEPDFVPTGITRLDEYLRGGMRPGELVSVPARPGMGKTAFALQVANNVARGGRRVLIFSAEMTAHALLRRASSEFSMVPAPLIDKRGPTGHPKLDAMREDYLRQVRGEMIHLPIYIDDTSRPSVGYMLDKARRLGDIDLVIFDYMSLANDGLATNASANDKMSKVSGDLMMMAKELHIPVMALAQLNRAVEQNKPYIPSLAHIRDSGMVEANSHIVLMLYRRSYYVDQQMLEPEGDDDGDYLDIFIQKNREGKTGKVRTRFDGATFSIRDV